MTPTFVVPAGAEERAIRRAVPSARLIVTRAGAAAAASLPADLDPAGRYVIAGTCGGLRGLPAASVVVYAAAVDESGEVKADAALAAETAARAGGVGLVRAYTASRVITKAADKRALGARFDADVVDMEGTHLLRALALRGIAAATLRCVSDDAGYDLPPIDDAIGPDGVLAPLVVAGAFAREPVAAARLIVDIKRALRALGEAAARLA